MSFYIAIDFDGTIAQHKFPEIGDEVPGAFEWMKRFQELGAKLFLWTMRSHDNEHDDVLTPAIEFCRERGVEFIGHNHNPEINWSTSNKQYAHLYIDDAAFGTPLVKPWQERPYVDWSIVGPAVEKIIMDGGGYW
jgi:hypothetical protein